MTRKPNFATSVLFVLVVLLQFAIPLSAQTNIPSPAELDQLLAPVALYPDSLLSQITTASTNPQEILDVDNWLAQNSGLTGTALTDAAQQQGFDPAFIALVNFPDVLDMMAQNIDDYAAIGAAFSADQGAVAASIQRLRDQAYRAGTLQTTSQQQVVTQQASGQTIYVIQPVNPQIVYVPQYDPTVVYVSGGPSLISFGVGIGIGALVVSNQPWGWGGWGWNWGARRAYYNHVYWVAWSNPYRPPRPWYRPRPIVWASRPGYGGNWRYRPPGYRPPRPRPPGPNRPPWGPNNRPGRPSVQPLKPGTPNRPAPNKPGPNRPGPNKPAPNKPGPNKPGPNNPAKPTNPRPRPQPEKPGTTNPSRPGRPTTPGETKPTPKPEKPGNPGRPGSGGGTNRPGENRPAPNRPTAPETKPNRPSNAGARPSQPSARPAPQAKPAGGNRPQSQKPAPKPKPEPKPKSD